jgi:hypothetical protein
MGQYLPDPIVRHIHAILAADEPPGARPLYLLRMCGVCKSWREFCSEIKPELLLDGLSGVGPGASKGTLLAFRKQTLQYKRAAFEGAAAVLQGGPTAGWQLCWKHAGILGYAAAPGSAGMRVIEHRSVCWLLQATPAWSCWESASAMRCCSAWQPAMGGA